jgi:predicted alpha-1,2-mannosidase
MGDVAGAEFFSRRAGNWTNVLDRSLGLVRGRDSRGAWRTPFSPFRFGGAKDWLPYDCTEGNAWQYTWHVFQDPEGLIAAHGGKKAFAAKLRGIFSMRHVKDGEEPDDCTGRIGEYIQGNEPSHHLLYFFPQIGEWDFAAEKIRYVCGEFYRNAVDGLCGNDDCGQMSAWYIFSCLGFYPFNPCGGGFVLGAPQVPGAVLRLRDDKVFTVVAENFSEENRYVQSVLLNGKTLKEPKISYADIMAGGELRFIMRKEKEK